MSDDGKTKEEHRAEMEALQRRIAELEGAKEDDGADDEKASGVEQSKRNLVRAGWVAPVILAINLPTVVFVNVVRSWPDSNISTALSRHDFANDHAPCCFRNQDPRATI